MTRVRLARRAARAGACASLASIALLAAVGAYAQDGSSPATSPPSVDHPHWWNSDGLMVLMQEYAIDGLIVPYANQSTDESYARFILGGPETPYSTIVERNLGAVDPQTARALAILSITHGPVSQHRLHEWKRWDLGYTRLSPMLAAPVPDDLKEFSHGVPHIMKAGLDPDIYKAAILWTDVLDHPTIVANYALALQVLRDKLAATPQAQWYERNLRPAVMSRFLDATLYGNPQHGDFHYLVQLLDGELSTWSPAKINRYGFRQLSGPFRVARIAAALNERTNRVSYACVSPETPDYTVAGMGGRDGRDLCFTAATDRAIHQWYVRRWIHEVMAFGGDAWNAELQNELARMVVPLLSSSQGFVGRLRFDHMHKVTSLETIDLKVANQLLSDGRMSHEQGDALVRNLFTKTCGWLRDACHSLNPIHDALRRGTLAANVHPSCRAFAVRSYRCTGLRRSDGRRSRHDAADRRR